MKKHFLTPIPSPLAGTASGYNQVKRMNLYDRLLRISPKKTAHRLALIVVLGLLVNVAVFFSLGVWQERKRILEYETRTFSIHSQPGVGEGAPSEVVMEVYDDKDRLTCTLVHTPIRNGSSGNLTVELLMTRYRGRMIGVDLIYQPGGSPEIGRKMSCSFLSEYNELMWSVDITLPEGLNCSYSFSLRYTPKHIDVYRFYDRAETAFHGNILYRDTSYRTESPPLIAYLLIPGYLLSNSVGDANIGFSIYFIFCAILAASVFYLLFRRWGEDRAYLMGLFLVCYPPMLSGAFHAEDEPLIVIFFIIPLFLLLIKRVRECGVMVGVAIGIKMWTLLLIPALYSTVLSISDLKKRFRESLVAAAAIAVPVVAVFLPFYILAGSDFTFFLRAYTGLAASFGVSTSIWYTLFGGTNFYSQAKLVLMAVIAVSTLGVLYCNSRRPVHPMRLTMVLFCIFFLFYAKIISGYYAFFVLAFLPAMTEDRLLLAEVFAIPVIIRERNLLFLPDIALFLAWLLLLDVLRRSLVKPYSFDGDLGDGVKDMNYQTFRLP